MWLGPIGGHHMLGCAVRGRREEGEGAGLTSERGSRVGLVSCKLLHKILPEIAALRCESMIVLSEEVS